MLFDSNGLRAVIKKLDSGLRKNKATYISDGKGKSNDLLEYCKQNISVPSEYSDFQMSVYHQGVQFKTTDHSLEYADYFLSLGASALIGTCHHLAGAALAIYSNVETFAGINNVDVFPDGYYDTYKVTTSWTEVYHWDGGTTYTHASYEFIVCWDTVSYPTPGWQIHKSRNNSYNISVYN